MVAQRHCTLMQRNARSCLRAAWVGSIPNRCNEVDTEAVPIGREVPHEERGGSGALLALGLVIGAKDTARPLLSSAVSVRLHSHQRPRLCTGLESAPAWSTYP